MRIILASKSPRRKELMDLAGFNYEVLPSNSEEKWDDTTGFVKDAANGVIDKGKDLIEKV